MRLGLHFRNGVSFIVYLGVVLIDEIHMIDDEDRGTRLNGLIKRIKHLYPHSQIIGLSATVKNPEFLAGEFNMNWWNILKGRFHWNVIWFISDQNLQNTI